MSKDLSFPRVWIVGLVVLLVLATAACDNASPPKASLSIVSGSENNTLEPLIQEWASQNNYEVDITYLGSVDISRLLQSGSMSYDAVWPANRLWLQYGDTHNLVRYDESIIRTPVVFGVKRSVAQRLGWIGKDVFMADILDATESGDVRFMMTSATQSNSGASFYFGALNAFAGSPEVLTASDLENPDVQDQIKRILGTIDRSSGSSGWLKSLFLEQYAYFDAMVNYEAVIIETNQELTRQGKEPLYVIYPVDGLAIADSPLGYIDHGEDAKETAFLALQEYLRSDPVRQKLIDLGRRATLVGMQVPNADRAVFNPEWGIDVSREFQPIKFPASDVIQQALTLYQTTFRKPSCTAYVLDYSGSMGSNNGEIALEQAMKTLLDQDIAANYLLQGHPGDISQIVLFNNTIINANTLDQWMVKGNDADQLLALYRKIEAESPGGGTNIFGATELALQRLEKIRTPECLPAVIMMTDGEDNEDQGPELERYIRSTENTTPVFAITFGSAQEEQIKPFITMTYGRIFDGRSDLVTAFRDAKGYN